LIDKERGQSRKIKIMGRKIFSSFHFLLITVLSAFDFLLLPQKAFAHCPLCTLGAGAAALGASWLGVSSAAVGLFLGAFAFALGWWFGNLLKKEYFKYQNFLLAVLSYLLTVFPLKGMFPESGSFYLYLAGNYGSLLNRTYLFNKFLIGSFLGALLVFISPYLSKKLTKLRKGRHFPFQGTLITFSLLVIAFLVIQFLL
jgi:hypothetical protein